MTDVKPKRVVSLIASATEIVCALGARDLLVGRSHECDFPPEVARLPSLTEPKFLVTGTSYDINARVKAIVQEGLSVYRVDAERLEALRPDIIVTQDQCDVCAVSLKDVEAALCAWGGRKVEIVSLKPDALADIWEDITKVARALGRERQGKRLVEELKARTASRGAKRRYANAPARRYDRVGRSADGRWQLDARARAIGWWREFIWRGRPTLALARLGRGCCRRPGSHSRASLRLRHGADPSGDAAS
jgi:hypothetical protein